CSGRFLTPLTALMLICARPERKGWTLSSSETK
ncbi:hypothetical protein AZZ89_004055, partial [Enterobacter hormaechei]